MILMLPTNSRQRYTDDSNITYRQSAKVSRRFQYYLQAVDKSIPKILILPTGSRLKYPDILQNSLQTVDKSIPTILILLIDSRQKYTDNSNITYRQSTKVSRHFQYYLQTIDKIFRRL